MEKTYKRKNRLLSTETKNKISTALKGRPKTKEHRKKISQGLVKYWENVPK